MCVLSAVRCAYYLPHFDAPFISMYAHFVGMYAHLNKSDTHLSGTCAHLSVHAHICWPCAHHLYRQHLHLLRLQTHTSLPGSYVGMHNTLTTSVGVQNAYRSMTTVALPTLTTLVLPSQPTSITGFSLAGLNGSASFSGHLHSATSSTSSTRAASIRGKHSLQKPITFLPAFAMCTGPS